MDRDTVGRIAASGSDDPRVAAAAYEQQLDANREWALSEGSLFFDGKGQVQDSLRRITQRLDELEIPYGVVGGMALFLHGYRRFTEVVDLLVRAEDLKGIHDSLRGRGYLPPFERSKQLRDTQSSVRIEFLTSGGFPGDGKPKAISFPDPSGAVEERQGFKVLRLERLIELKLASGMTAPHRLRDLVDVQEFVAATAISKDFSEKLHQSVRDKFLELWDLANRPATGPDADVFDE